MSKVLLAYSGGLDTSVSLHWLRTQKNLQVLTFTADVGQGDSLKSVVDRAMRLGAESAIVLDLQEEYLRDYAFSMLRAGGRHTTGHFLAAALTRPLIVRELVRIAREENCEFVAHGGTPKGHNQLRFELGIAATAPEIRVISPLREWPMRSREDEVAYVKRHALPIPLEHEGRFSIDRTLWGCSYKSGDLEDAWAVPPEALYQMTRDPRKAPDEPRTIVLGFESGVPVSLDGQRQKPVALVRLLNALAGEHGIGRLDVIEDRLLGIKSREVYESPAAAVLYAAHDALDALTLAPNALETKAGLARTFANLAYRGLWSTDLREALEAFFERLEERVTGEIRARLFKGGVTIEGRRSPYSLHHREMSAYGSSDDADLEAASGFIRVLSLPLVAEARARAQHLRDTT